MFETIVILIGALLAVFSVAVLAFPLMKSRSGDRPEVPEPEGADEFRELDSLLDSLYESIRSLRLENEMGEVEENLYRQQMSDYRLRAATVLRQREQQQANAALLLEQEVLMARITLAGADGNSAGENSAGSSGRCPSCGAVLDQEAAECPKCAVKPGLQDPDLP